MVKKENTGPYLPYFYFHCDNRIHNTISLYGLSISLQLEYAGKLGGRGVTLSQLRLCDHS